MAPALSHGPASESMVGGGAAAAAVACSCVEEQRECAWPVTELAQLRLRCREDGPSLLLRS